MLVHGFVWFGYKPWDFERTVELFERILGMPRAHEQATSVLFEAVDGSAIALFKPDDVVHDTFSPPVAGLLVDDVVAARAHLEARGIHFLGDVREGQPGVTWATAWSHFRAPDGNRYVIMSRSVAHPGGAPRRFRELRVVLRVDDVDRAATAFQHGLGLPIVEHCGGTGGRRGLGFAVCPTSIELREEGDHPLALRAEVEDPASAVADVMAAGGMRCDDGNTVVLHGDVQLSLFRPADDDRGRAAARRRLLKG